MNAALNTVSAALGAMNPLDWVIALVLAASTITAFLRGLIRSLVSLAGVLFGLVIAAWYTAKAAAFLGRWIVPPSFARVVAFVGILLLVYLASAVVGRLLRGACSAIGLGLLDRFAGAGFGFLRGVLLLVAVLLPVAQYLPYFAPARQSIFLPYLLPAAHGISFVVPRDFGKHLSRRDWFEHANAAASEFTHPDRAQASRP
jgi:membrane protein required for colicin V production